MLTVKSIFPTTCIAAAMILGCTNSGSTVDPARIARQREKFLSAEELANPVTVADVRATIEKSDDPSAPIPVVLIGQVGGVPNPFDSQPDFPWRKDKASFYLVDQTEAKKLSAHLKAEGPDHQNCAFCARAIKKCADSMADVNFYNNKGQPVSIGAQDLFDLKVGDLVVVEGEAMMLGKTTMLVVDAKKLYVKR